MKPGPNWTLGVQGHVFRTADSLSTPAVHISDNLGKELDLSARIQATDNFSVTLTYALFIQGEAFRDTPGVGRRHRDNRVYLNMEYTF